MGGVVFFVSVVLGLTLYGAASWLCEERGGRAAQVEGSQRGPVPGYTYYPGVAVDVGLLGLSEGWSPTSMEAFHGRGRRRVVLTAGLRRGSAVASEAEVIVMLERATRQVLWGTGAEVAVLELASDPEGLSARRDWTAMRTRDGMGWTGKEAEGAFVVERGDVEG